MRAISPARTGWTIVVDSEASWKASLQKEIGEAQDRAAALVAAPADRLRQGVVGAMGEGIAVDDEQRAGHALRPFPVT
jgi:hypothetical protein